MSIIEEIDSVRDRMVIQAQKQEIIEIKNNIEYILKGIEKLWKEINEMKRIVHGGFSDIANNKDIP